MRFRMRHHRPEAAPAAPVAIAERPAPEWLPAEASAPEAPVVERIRGGLDELPAPCLSSRTNGGSGARGGW